MKHSHAGYQKNRPLLCKFVETDLSTTQHAIISAPPKSGKSEYPIYEKLHLLEASNDTSVNTSVKVAFISNLNRRDCKDQRDLYERCGISAFFGGRKASKVVRKEMKGEEISKVKTLEDFVVEFEQWTSVYAKIIVYIDESDYGTGDEQSLAPAFDAIYAKRMNPMVFTRLLSATNQEALYSDFAAFATELYPAISPSYRGAKWFLDKGLVRESTKFFTRNASGEYSLSDQGKEAMDRWLTDFDNGARKPFAVLREKSLYSEMSKNPKQWRKIVDPLNRIRIQYVDGEHPFFWGDVVGNDDEDDSMPDDIGAAWSTFSNQSRPTLIVVNETCTRSTKVGFHPLIHFWHDHPTDSAVYNTIAQAIGRVFHYDYTPNQYWSDPSVNMRVYGEVAAVKLLSADAKDKGKAEQYKMETGRQLSARIRQSISRDHMTIAYSVIPDREESTVKRFISENLDVYDISSELGFDITKHELSVIVTGARGWKVGDFIKEFQKNNSLAGLSGGIGRVFNDRGKFVTHIVRLTDKTLTPSVLKKLKGQRLVLRDGSSVTYGDLVGKYLIASINGRVSMEITKPKSVNTMFNGTK